MKVNERYSKHIQTYTKVGETHMNHYTKQLFHSSTADIEKRKGLISNIKSAEREADQAGRKAGTIASRKEDLKDPNKVSAKDREALNKAKQGITDAHKALANHDWYMHNKQWKKEYNQEYYQNNKDYWKKRLDESQARWDKYDEKEPSTAEEIRDVTGARTDTYSARINYERAEKEYNDFMKNNSYSNTPISSFSGPHQSSLIDKGIKAISAIATPILGFLAKLFS